MSFSPRSIHLLKQFLIGGASIGGAAGLGTSLAHYLRGIHQDADDQAQGPDPDALYVNLRKPNPAAPAKMASWGGGTAMAGGVLAAGGAYTLVQHLYKKMRQRQLQSKLNEAQQSYGDTLEEEAKQAGEGKPMSMFEGLTGAPVASGAFARPGHGRRHQPHPGQSVPDYKAPKPAKP